MARLILIRHGETDWNVEGRWQGQADVPLNARGREQAERLAEAMGGNGLSAIYSSDLARARETAKPLARAAGLPIHLDPRLREIDQGDWEGLLISEIQTRYAEEFHSRVADPWTVAPPGGETSLQVRERVLAAVRDILNKHPHGTIAIVSHGFALAVIRAHFDKQPISAVWDLVPGNCEPAAIEVQA